MSSHLPIRRTLCQCVRSNPGSALRHFPQRQQTRLLSSSRSLRAAANPLRNASRSGRKSHTEYKRSIVLSAAGMASCAVAMFGVINIYFPQGVQKDDSKDGIDNGAIKLDGPPGLAPKDDSTVIIDGVEQVSTGNSTIPHFPKSIRLPASLDSPDSRRQSARTPGEEIKKSGEKEEDYYLLGLGIRTVSFLNIQVYVVGFYIAVSDMATLQQRLVREAAPPSISGVPSESAVTATSLVPKEREDLRKALLDPEQGEEVWNQILKEGGIRTAIRIVPTRNTDFLHLRDGWVRAITGRAQRANVRAKALASKELDAQPQSEFADDSFGEAMGDFKALLGGGGGGRKSVPKGQTLLLLRDKVGALEILYQPGDAKPSVWLGEVLDERISRLLWLQYLAGKVVASDGARRAIIDGVMGIVERPVGTVEQMVA
ncbi:Altered inheritance of mitochondria protein 18 mitochondrial [Coccidioides immitis]|nr:Altered inheritance of mitochondria protein 18 mitochondrial [Coccidioides immitis]